MPGSPCGRDTRSAGGLLLWRVIEDEHPAISTLVSVVDTQLHLVAESANDAATSAIVSQPTNPIFAHTDFGSQSALDVTGVHFDLDGWIVEQDVGAGGL